MKMSLMEHVLNQLLVSLRWEEEEGEDEDEEEE